MHIQFIFRLDASPIIGVGHLYRCLTIANQASDFNIQSTFVCRKCASYDYAILKDSEHQLLWMSPNNTEQLIDDVAHGHTNATDHWFGDTPQNDALEFIALTKKLFSPVVKTVLIMDHYGINIDWENCVENDFDLLVTLNDKPERHTKAQIILDQTASRTSGEYNGTTKKSSKVLCGEQFALLSQQFLAAQKQLVKAPRSFDTVKKVLVTFGGADPLNLSGRFIESIAREFDTLEYIVVTTSSNTNIDQVRASIRRCEQLGMKISLIVDTSQMAGIMLEADICFGAAGSSAWERAFLGLPSAIVAFERNQIDIAKALKQKKCSIVFDVQNFIPKAKEAMNLLLKDKQYRESLATNSTELIDGLGCQRLISGIKRFLK